MMGDVASYKEDGCNVTFNCQKGKVRLSFLKEDLVRVHMAPAGKVFPTDELHLNENGPYAVVTCDQQQFFAFEIGFDWVCFP